MLRTTVLAAAVLGLIGTTLAHDYGVRGLAIDHPWARATAPGQPNGAAYFSITNSGDDDRLVGVQSPAAERVELHGHEHGGDGVVRMRPVESIALGGGETVALAPGGMHVMLIGLAERLAEGDRIPLTLIFERAGPLEVEVQVEAIGYGLGGDTGGHAEDGEGHGHDGHGH